MPRSRPGARSLGLIAVLLGMLVVLATPAWADHEVAWGIDRSDGPREIETDEPVEFVVSVMLAGGPVADWPITARVTDEAGEVIDRFSFTTDDQGIGRVLVPAGGVRIVEICDEDGCVHGDATIYPVGVAPTAPASEEPEDSTETPGASPTETAPTRTNEPGDSPAAGEATTEPTREPTTGDEPVDDGATLVAEEGGDGDGSNLAAWVAVFVILTATAGGAVAWRQRSR